MAARSPRKKFKRHHFRTSQVVDKCWKDLIWFDTSLTGGRERMLPMRPCGAATAGSPPCCWSAEESGATRRGGFVRQ